MPKAQSNFAKISDEKVRERTGKSWKQWFRIIDGLDLETNGHRHVAMTMFHKYKLNAWWSQAVTIRYEWEHGHRTVKNQREATPHLPIFKSKPSKKVAR
ncbi:MAG TPA: hypothetical protein VMH23_07695 [Bacteroidota bacterium]|nr:hypothetical protein [Bacteroidota bacterium]